MRLALCVALAAAAPPAPEVVCDFARTNLTVDARYVSAVLDPSSLALDGAASKSQFSDPRGAGLLNLTHPRLVALARRLAPALLVVTGGRSNCVGVVGRDGYASPYCARKRYAGVPWRAIFKNVPSRDGRRYAGTASARNFAALGAFAEATGTDLAWHLNPTIRDGAGVFDGAAAASLPAETRAVLLFEELHRRPSASKSKLKEAPTAASLAADFRSLRRSFAGTVVGVLNQDADEDAAWTDEAYGATRGDVDRVAFSYYASSEFLPRKRKHEGCAAYGAARADVAAGVVDAGHGARFDAVAARYAGLARRLGKPAPWAVAVAPCTHAPEGSGFGAADAVAGALWYAARRPSYDRRSTPTRRYADLLGRAAAAGVGLLARQTLAGGVYGLLDSHTYEPTPSFDVAETFSAVFGADVLRASCGAGQPGVAVYAHASGGGAVAVLVVNAGARRARVRLPRHEGPRAVVRLEPAGGGGLAAPRFAKRAATEAPGEPLDAPPFSATFATLTMGV